MNKYLALLTIFFCSSVLAAQEVGKLGQKEVLGAFAQYNPAALEKASAHKDYGELLNKLSLVYSAEDTEENRLELIALVKNFDNSIFLQQIKNNYEDARVLQLVTGTDLKALNQATYQSILVLVKSIFDNTIEVKKIQQNLYKKELKNIKKNKTLSAEEKTVFSKAIKAKIENVKKEIKLLRTGHKQKIRDTAKVYFTDIKSAYDAREKALLQTGNSSVKSNPQKTAAQ